MPVNYNGGQSPLEAAAITQRGILIPINTYNNASVANEYTATHSRAISDGTTAINGKGSGNFLDIENYAAIGSNGVGGDWDVNGNQTNSAGSGRVPAFGLNGGLWGYGPVGMSMSNYQHPNTSGNIGQVII